MTMTSVRTTSEPDAELGARFARETEPLFEVLARGARRLTRSAADAEDLLQDTLLHAYAGFHTFHDGSNLKAWLFRILLNLYRNELRLHRRRGEHVPVETLLVEPSVAPAQPGRIALNEMSKAIDTLNGEQREALLLVVLEGLSYSEAADALEIPLGTLMSRLGRARAALRKLTGSGEEPRLRTVK